MTISRQNLTIIIVTYKSEDVIHDCIKSIPSDINILIVDNSGEQEFKQRIENKYSNVSCILSPKNLGMGSGNNLGLRNVKSDYALILNPDVILEEKTIDELISASKQIKEYSIIAPISKDENYPNYKSSNDSSDTSDDEKPFKVNSIDGYAMLFNLNKINKLKGFENFNYFDENIFFFTYLILKNKLLYHLLFLFYYPFILFFLYNLYFFKYVFRYQYFFFYIK